MGAFDDYLNERGGGAFDAYVRAQRPRMSWDRAAWRGVQDGLTFNFADEFAGLVGGEEERERVRAEQARARDERPGWYTAGSVGSAFLPFGAATLGLRGASAAASLGNAASAGARLARGASAASAPAATLASTASGLAKTLGGAAAGGAAYGSVFRMGDHEGDTGEDASLFSDLAARAQAVTPGSVASDAVFGVGGYAGLAALGVLGRGVGKALEQQRARFKHDSDIARADQAVASAEREAAALLPHDVADGARNEAFQRMVDEAISAQGANPNSLQSMAQRFGINLPRSMAGADRNGRQWLWEAYDGVHGPGARKEAERIVGQLFDETPSAFMRIVDDGERLAPVSAQEGASEVRARLQQRNELERQTENNAWGAFSPKAATFRFSKRGAAGLPTLGREVDARLLERRIFFDHDNQQMAEIYRRMYPRAAMSRDAVKLYIDGIDRGRPGTLEDIVNLRRFISDAYDAARDDADRAAVYAVQRGLDDWLDHSMGSNIRQSGQEVAAQFEAANQATQRNRQLFADNKHVAKMVAEEGDAERALSTLIGTRGVVPQHGAHLTMRALRERLGRDSETWRTLKLTILRRFSDPLEEALNRDNPRAFNTVYAQLDDFLKKHQEFITETFTPNERMRLYQLRGVLRQMQTPGPGASNPSRSGITAANLLQQILPGAKTAGDIFRDAVLAPRAARQQMEMAARPEVAGPALRSAAGGLLMGPESLALSMGAGAMNTRLAQENEMRRREAEALFEDMGYGY